MAKLRGDICTRRSKDGGVWDENRRTRFRTNIRGHGIHRTQTRTCLRKSVKAAAPADAVTMLRRSGPLLVDNSLRRRRDSSDGSIAYIAVRRMNYQAHQYRAQQPCDEASRCCNRAIQAINDNHLTRSPDASVPTVRFTNEGS